MSIKIVHLIDSLRLINYGIFNSAFYASEYLKETYGAHSMVLVTRKEDLDSRLNYPFTIIQMDNITEATIKNICQENQLESGRAVVVSHGCWGRATMWASKFRHIGLKWIYTPHGMLEPWSLQHKWLKKKIYFEVIEKRLANHADGIRAVSAAEEENLKSKFRLPVHRIENGVIIPPFHLKSKEKKTFLFMARLHQKKGILPLVKAWNRLPKNDGDELIIAGPNEGELDKIKPLMNNDSIKYMGSVYGDDKVALLKRAHYYVLPSFSEGFPTSVIEAMSYGLIPLISAGCNFPVVFKKELGYQIEPDENQIAKVLKERMENPFNENLSYRNWQHVNENNSETHIGRQLWKMYCSLMPEHSV